MKCSKCNNKINESQEVCLNCGHILGYESENSKKCIHCNREIPLSYRKCPYCKKNQKRKRYILKVLTIIIVIILDILILNNLYSAEVKDIKKSYKEDCKSVTVQELIKDNKKLDEHIVKITGQVKDVTESITIFNRVRIELEIDNHILYIYYNNKNSTGYLNGDTVTVYGKYKKLSGNKPIIYAKYINIKK